MNCAHKLLSHRNLFAEIRRTCLDSYPPRWRLLDAPIGHKVLQLQGPSTDEAEGRAHWGRTVYVSLPQDPQRVGIIEGDSSFVTVQTHSQSGWQRSSVRVRHAAMAATVGVHCPLALAVRLALSVTMSLRKKDLAHAHCEETEGWSVLAVLCPTVMAAVWVAARCRQRGGENQGVQTKNSKGGKCI